MIEELLFEIRKNIGCLYKVSESIARLDLIASFASYVTVTPACVRPEFSTDGPLGALYQRVLGSFSWNYLAIKQGRHPVVEKLFKDPFIPVRRDGQIFSC